MSAENIRAFMPRPSASQSATKPRSTGSFITGCLYIAAFNGSSWTIIEPSGARTATAMYLCPRIITPSITACPP